LRDILTGKDGYIGNEASRRVGIGEDGDGDLALEIEVEYYLSSSRQTECREHQGSEQFTYNLHGMTPLQLFISHRHGKAIVGRVSRASWGRALHALRSPQFTMTV
jgi:hypothetical protein